MSFSLNKIFLALVVISAMLVFVGCIADSAEDKDLPWSSNQGWEGMIPLPAGALNQYD
jgi:hypothetical protein